MKTWLLVFSAVFILNGCAATRMVQHMNYDKVDLEPKQLVKIDDGSIAIESILTKSHKEFNEKYKAYVYANPDYTSKAIKKSKRKKITIGGQEHKVRMLRIKVEPPNKEAWHILTSDSKFPAGTYRKDLSFEGETFSLETPFEYKIKNRIYIARIDEIKLDRKVSRVPSGRLSAAQIILYMPAVLFDIVTSPIQLFIYGNMYGKGKYSF